MATQTISNTGHDELIHDAVLDYYGRRLATCSSDKTIKIFDIEADNTHRLLDTLRGHDGPVWSVAWAHPKFGPSLLASSSYSGQVLIHREAAPAWALVHASTTHAASVNAVAWAPHEIGLATLAAASSDGSVSLLEMSGGSAGASGAGGGAAAGGAAAAQQAGAVSFVQIAHFPAHGLGANAVGWAPAQAPGSLTSGQQQPQGAGAVTKRLVTGGSDGLVKIWEIQAPNGQPSIEPVLVAELSGHTDWVRDVAWSSTVLRKSYIASASEDRTVRIWTSENGADWTCTALPTFDAAAWRVSWSLSGNVLAVSTGDNKVTLWKEKLAGGWELVKSVDESS